MPHKVEFNEAIQVIEVVFSAPITKIDLDEATRTAIEVGKARETHRYIIDNQDPEPYVSLADVYALPEHQYIVQQLSRDSRIAIMLPQSIKAREIVIFYETVCLNRGWQARIFTTREEAMDWLFA